MSFVWDVVSMCWLLSDQFHHIVWLDWKYVLSMFGVCPAYVRSMLELSSEYARNIFWLVYVYVPIIVGLSIPAIRTGDSNDEGLIPLWETHRKNAAIVYFGRTWTSTKATWSRTKRMRRDHILLTTLHVGAKHTLGRFLVDVTMPVARPQVAKHLLCVCQILGQEKHVSGKTLSH